MFGRILALRTADESASPHYLEAREQSASSSSQTPISIVLCDGTCTWRGELSVRDLTPPRGTPLDDFRTQLLNGLRQGPGDAIFVALHKDKDIELTWTSTLDDEVGFTYMLRQVAVLKADHVQGEGLRMLLGALVDEFTVLQRRCQYNVENRVQLQVCALRVPF